MPFINIKVLKGALTNEQKADMIKRVSETVAEIEASPHPKDNLVPYTWCNVFARNHCQRSKHCHA